MINLHTYFLVSRLVKDDFQGKKSGLIAMFKTTSHSENSLTLCRYIGALPVVTLDMKDKDHKNVTTLRREWQFHISTCSETYIAVCLSSIHGIRSELTQSNTNHIELKSK